MEEVFVPIIQWEEDLNSNGWVIRKVNNSRELKEEVHSYWYWYWFKFSCVLGGSSLILILKYKSLVERGWNIIVYSNFFTFTKPRRKHSSDLMRPTYYWTQYIHTVNQKKNKNNYIHFKYLSFFPIFVEQKDSTSGPLLHKMIKKKQPGVETLDNTLAKSKHTLILVTIIIITDIHNLTKDMTIIIINIIIPWFHFPLHVHLTFPPETFP